VVRQCTVVLPEEAERANMHHPLVVVLVFFLAIRSLALGIQSSGGSKGRPIVSAETERDLLAIVTFCLLGLLASLVLMERFPNLGVIIAEYNKF
jgi:hypothetical protein